VAIDSRYRRIAADDHAASLSLEEICWSCSFLGDCGFELNFWSRKWVCEAERGHEDKVGEELHGEQRIVKMSEIEGVSLII
jgi:hypothetical protein